VALLRKKPEKIMSGTRTGPDMARATFSDGAAAEMHSPNETEQFATRIIIRQHIRKRPPSLLRFDIQ